MLGRLGTLSQTLEGGPELVVFPGAVRTQICAGSQVRQGFGNPAEPHELAAQGPVCLRGGRVPDRVCPEGLGVVPDLDLTPCEDAEGEHEKQWGNNKRDDAQPGA